MFTVRCCRPDICTLLHGEVYKTLLRQWHPDKNLDDGNVATRVFQYLQEKKDWLMAD